MQVDSSSVATEELMHCAWLGFFSFSFFATSITTQFVLQLQLPLTTLSPAPQAENFQAPLIAEVPFPPIHLPWFAQNLLSFNSSSFSKLRMIDDGHQKTNHYYYLQFQKSIIKPHQSNALFLIIATVFKNLTVI
jgi:hypothetical protein